MIQKKRQHGADTVLADIGLTSPPQFFRQITRISD